MNMLDPLFDWLLQASLRASILTVVVLLTQHLLRKHLSARILHALWLPVLIVTLMPIWPQSRWSAESLIMEARPVTTAAPAAPSTPVPVMKRPPTVMKAERSLPWAQMGAFIWAAGSVGFAVAGLISLGSTLRRFRRTACAPESETVDMVASLARQIGLKQAPQICQSEAISSPAVAGLFRPVLLLPANFTQTFTAHEAKLVLKHELTHLKRGDLIMNALLCVLMALHWFNPLLWLAFHKARIDREAACDEDVLRHGSPDERCAYGHALLKAEAAFCPRGWSLGFVGIFDRGAGLRTRIRAIASPGSRHPQMRLFACILMALMTYLGSTQAQSSGPEKKGAQILIDTKLGPDLSQGSESVKSRSDVNGPSVVIDLKIMDVSAIGTLKLLSTSTTLKNDLTVMGIADGKADSQVQMLTDVGGTVLSSPRIYTVSGNQGRIQVKRGGKQDGDPFEKDASFVGTRCTLLPTLKGDTVNLEVDIEHVATPGQTTRFQTTETMKNGSTILLSNLQAAAGKPRLPIILITLAWNAEEGPVVKKLQSIIIPRVQFRDATLEEALEFFRAKARTLDTAETDTSKRGVNIVLKTKEASQTKISLDLTNVPLEEALKYTTELANVDYWIEGSAVAITAKAKTSGGQAQDITAKGKVVEKAKQIILPQVQFSEASLEEAVEFLSAQLRGREDNPGINIILKPGGGKSSISLDLKDVPLWEALRYASELGNHTLSADDHSIIFTPR
ncbi:MAG: M56 family metallopeptidase [Verrucomicrobiota bacterium]